MTDVDGVRSIMLNRPDSLNAINVPMLQLLDEAVARGLRDPAVRVFLLTGRGRAFCAGDDVEAQAHICEAGEGALREQLALLQRISHNLVLGAKPVVGAVQGWAIGAGLSWILNCDFVLCGPEAKGFFPEVGFGTFVTGGATWLLPRLAGSRFASEMLYRARRIDAATFVSSGIASALVADRPLDKAALELARELAALPPLAAQSMKRALSGLDAGTFNLSLETEATVCVETTLDPATLDRMRASLKQNT